jgi:hypothetical protein
VLFAAAGWQEVQRAINSRDEPVDTGPDEY